jgi:hypothetical protein
LTYVAYRAFLPAFEAERDRSFLPEGAAQSRLRWQNPRQTLAFSYDAVLDDATRIDVTFPDFYLTPFEKYAKRPDGFPVKARIVFRLV